MEILTRRSAAVGRLLQSPEKLGKTVARWADGGEVREKGEEAPGRVDATAARLLVPVLNRRRHSLSGRHLLRSSAGGWTPLPHVSSSPSSIGSRCAHPPGDAHQGRAAPRPHVRSARPPLPPAPPGRLGFIDIMKTIWDEMDT
jgi:hypothetical protein